MFYLSHHKTKRSYAHLLLLLEILINKFSFHLLISTIFFAITDSGQYNNWNF